MKKKHSFDVRRRAFAIWQELGYLPWKKQKATVKKGSGDFYKGAFDSIPFLNDDAKRTFTHLLLRPGYMIRDYINGDHERYLAPLTALIIFYAFFALVSAVLQPIQQKQRDPFDSAITFDAPEGNERGVNITRNTIQLVQQGYTLLTLDQHPEAVDTQWKSSLAALEGTLRSQGIPLFLGEFLLLWLAMVATLKKYKPGLSIAAAASAYILCQFSFFMLFALLLTLGQSTTVSASLMLALVTIDFRQWLGLSWPRSLKLAIKTGLMYIILFVMVLLALSAAAVLIALFKS